VLHKLCIYFLDTKAKQMLQRPFSRQQGLACPPSPVPVSRDRWLLLDGDFADHLVFEFLQVLLCVALSLYVSGLVAEFALLGGRPRGGGNIGESDIRVRNVALPFALALSLPLLLVGLHRFDNGPILLSKSGLGDRRVPAQFVRPLELDNLVHEQKHHPPVGVQCISLPACPPVRPRTTSLRPL
jgi:hypothetical protein